MLMHKLSFNPHIVWADTDGFHVFGYGKRYYHYLPPNGNRKQWGRDSNIPGIHHFNKVVVATPNSSNGRRYDLIRPSVYGVITVNDQNITSLVFYRDNHKTYRDTFWSHDTTRPIVKNDSGRVIGQVPPTANYDQFDDLRVFSWGFTFMFEKKDVSRLYRFGKPYDRELGHVSCTDAKFSPNGKTVAIAVRDGIKFISTDSLIEQCAPETEAKLEKWDEYGIASGYCGSVLKVDRELSIDGLHVHHLAFSVDGCTLAAVTKCHKLVVWDVD